MQELAMELAGFRRGVRLLNEGAYFEAHEVLEDVWREAPHAEKKFLQGLIQVAVALYHHSRGNRVGACSLLARGRRNLGGYPEDFAGIALDRLRESLNHWQDSLNEGAEVPAVPKVEWCGDADGDGS